MKSISEIISEIVWPSYETLHKSLATGKITDIYEGLRDLLEKASIPPAVAQLMLLDRENSIMFAIANPDHSWPETAKRMLNHYRLSLLGVKFEIKDGFYRQIIEKARSQENSHGSLFVVCEQLTQTEVETRGLDLGVMQNVIDGYYDVYRLNFDSKTAIVEKTPLFPNIYIPFITSGETGAMSAAIFNDPEITRWFRRLVFLVNTWPESGNMPAIGGIVAFLLDSKDVVANQLVELKDSLLLLSWLIQSSAFAFQSYALSQASSEETTRLSEELSFIGWGEFLRSEVEEYNRTKNEADKRSFEEAIDSLLKIGSEFVKKRVLRDLATFVNNKPIVADVLRNKITEALNPTDIENRRASLTALRLVEVFYPYMDNKTLTKCITANVLPATRFWLLGSPDSPVESFLKDPDGLSGFHSALAAIESAFFYDERVRQPICDTLVAVANSAALLENETVQERLIATIFLVLSQCNPQQSDRLNETVANAIIGYQEKNKIPLDLSDRLFTLLKDEQRQEILEKIRIPGVVSEQLNIIHKEQSGFGKAQLQSHASLEPLQVISIASSKGGVGKSLMALSVASSLALQSQESNKVCLIDLDFFAPTLNYTLGHSEETAGEVFLNDYIWARYLQQDNHSENAQKRINEIFEDKPFWRRRFENLPRNERDLLNRVMVDTPLQRLKIIPSSLCNGLQDMMMPFLAPDDGYNIISGKLYGLLHSLREDGYSHVVFDTPAELKELTMCATQLSTKYEGKNVFVTTLYGPSIDSMLKLLCTGYYAIGRNYLLINKARQLDSKYAKDQSAFVDYWSTRERFERNQTCSVLSTVLTERLMNVRQVGYMPWIEYLDRLWAEPRQFRKKDYERLVSKTQEYIDFIIGNS